MVSCWSALLWFCSRFASYIHSTRKHGVFLIHRYMLNVTDTLRSQEVIVMIIRSLPSAIDTNQWLDSVSKCQNREHFRSETRGQSPKTRFNDQAPWNQWCWGIGTRQKIGNGKSFHPWDWCLYGSLGDLRGLYHIQNLELKVINESDEANESTSVRYEKKSPWG